MVILSARLIWLISWATRCAMGALEVTHGQDVLAAAPPPTPLTAAPRPGPGRPRTPPGSTGPRPAREPGTGARTPNIRRPGGGPADPPIIGRSPRKAGAA